ncbi:MAG: cation-transporting P-type ATPase, partial [Deltaproteobacteria bacterium]|nr:cation-transporting P-type ATPase [Deltaproteobacteria bacterium]
MNWHQQKTDEVMQKLGSSARGLSADEVRTRLLEHGPNELTETAKKTVLMMFLDQFKDFMILVLIAAAAISG